MPSIVNSTLTAEQSCQIYDYYLYTHTRMHTHTHTHARTCTRTHARTHTRTHARTHRPCTQPVHALRVTESISLRVLGHLLGHTLTSLPRGTKAHGTQKLLFYLLPAYLSVF